MTVPDEFTSLYTAYVKARQELEEYLDSAMVWSRMRDAFIAARRYQEYLKMKVEFETGA